MAEPAINEQHYGGNMSDEGQNHEKQYVVFRLGAEVFGLEINKVREIIVYRETTQVPGTGEYVEGIINLRGHVIPIFSLKKKFGFPESDQTKNTRIVVVEAGGNTVGLVVDGVNEVLMIAAGMIEQPSSMFASGVDANYISGIANLEDRLIIILDLEKIICPGLA